MKKLLLWAAAGSLAAPLPAAPGVPPLAALAAAIGSPEARAAIGGIAAQAEVAGPRSRFTAGMISLADGTAKFVQASPGGRSETLVAADGSSWRREEAGGPFAPGDATLAGQLRGHEVHRMLLDLERRFRATGAVSAAGCLELAAADGKPAAICPGESGGPPARLELGLAPQEGGDRVTIELGDWRTELGVALPHAASFVHRGERWEYRFTALLPFRVAPGVALPGEPEALSARLGDLEALAAAHRRVLVAHQTSDPDLLVADAAERGTNSARGVLSESAREAVRERMRGYLGAIRFARYEDVVVPVVAVARDGSLGWVGCEIAAEGVRRDEAGGEEPIAYGFSWVELYAAEGGRWRAIGNASSPKP